MISHADAAAELLRRRAARESLEHFTPYTGIGYVPAAHHKLVIQRLEALERGDITRLILAMPPGSAKSLYTSILFPAWYLGRNPGVRILAASHTTELAERWGRRVRNIVSSDEFAALWPECRLAPDSMAAGRWATTTQAEYYAAGVGSAILGIRAELGVLDDPVSGREAADSELQRQRLWEWYQSDFVSRLVPGAKVVLVMQRWHEDDLAGRLLADQEKGGERWEVLKLPMESEGDGDPLGRPAGALLWPEWYTPEMVEQAKRDPRVWTALYQQAPRAGTGGEFKREWVRQWKATPHCPVKYILVDPASGKRKTNDFTAIWVIGLGHDGNLYALDVIRDRLNLAERAAEVLRLHRLYKPLQVRYEKYGMQADIEHLQSEMERQSYRFNVVEVGGSLRKEDRIRRLIPLFEQGKVWLPQSKNRTQHDGRTVDLVHEFIETEYLSFPVGRHDDMLDALARIADPDVKLAWPTLEDSAPPRLPAWKPYDQVVGM